MQQLKLTEIQRHRDTQPRAAIDQDVVNEYAEVIATLPPVTVYYDGKKYWLADGYHRYYAHCKLGALEIAADIYHGSRRDAVLHSIGANATHGLRRTNADKRRAVEGLLADEEWATWSDNDIAKHCVVSPTFVGDIRRSLSTVDSGKPVERKYRTKHGTQATMRTDNIGRKATSKRATSATPSGQDTVLPEPFPPNVPANPDVPALPDANKSVNAARVNASDTAATGAPKIASSGNGKASIDRISKEIEQLQKRIKKLQRDLSKRQQTITSLKAKLETAKAEIGALRHKIEPARDIEDVHFRMQQADGAAS
jgi:hypothetical protein